jgi:hypothetical protein
LGVIGTTMGSMAVALCCDCMVVQEITVPKSDVQISRTSLTIFDC